MLHGLKKYKDSILKAKQTEGPFSLCASRRGMKHADDL